MIGEGMLRSALSAAEQWLDGSDNELALSLPLGDGGCRIGRQKGGRIVLVVPPSSAYGLRLSRIEYRPMARLEFVDAEGTSWEEDAGILSCEVVTDAEDHIVLGIFGHVINSLDLGVDVSVVDKEVNALRSLFASLRTASQREEVGLWGELLVIAESRDPGLLAEAWGADPQRVFDFATENDRLEVKTTCAAGREHIFSLSQLHQSKTSNTVVASIMTTEVPFGTAVLDILRRVEDRLLYRPELRQAVVKRAVEVAGLALNEPRRFDEDQARASMRLLPFGEIPSPIVPVEVVAMNWTPRLINSTTGDVTSNRLAATLT